MRPVTTTAILTDLRDANNAGAWAQFDSRYRPILIGLGRHLGLDEHDAEEVAQETLAEFAREYRAGKYERERGRLGAWITGIARNRIRAMIRERERKHAARGSSALGQVPDDVSLSKMYEEHRARAILAEALRELRENTRTSPNTVRAFELFALEGVPVEAVAAECGLDPAEVYRIKNRLTKSLREIVTRLEKVFSEDG